MSNTQGKRGQNMSDATLRKFCAPGTYDYSMEAPYNVGEFTYAVDGHIALRVPLRHEYDGNTGPGTVDQIVKGALARVTEATIWLDIPDVRALLDASATVCPECKGKKDYPCPECKGTGEVTWTSEFGNHYSATCERCQGAKTLNSEKFPCDLCDGEGRLFPLKEVEIEGKLFDPWLLLRLRETLPGCQIAPAAAESLAPNPLRFDGGVGVIMPRRRRETT